MKKGVWEEVDVSGTLVFNPNSRVNQASTNQPVEGVAIALQVRGNQNAIGSFTG